MKRQVFLGGACGTTTWRKEIAIPLLGAAGVSYFDPQLGPGEWTPACEAAEMKAKAEADVQLFVINGETRGVAGIAEAAFFLGSGRPMALVVADVPAAAVVEGEAVGAREGKDLNRGRLFLRTMAAAAGVPVFERVEEATRHAIELVKRAKPDAALEHIRAILERVRFPEVEFIVEPAGEAGCHVSVVGSVADVRKGEPTTFTGRKWFVPRDAADGEVVRTAFKAVQTWQEHETRERFRYRGVPVFGPHADVESLVALGQRPS